ncbi:cold shock domain-containing protein [Gracilimonas sp.]|uniref:cold shock domain-containing protein n=1 Tax=Gracilimonas sp. TaxID=1974203 RepID=UPI003D12B00B
MSQDYEIGILKWFDREKGFGVIGAPEGEEYFLHKSNVKGGLEKFRKLYPVFFKKGYDEKRDKLTAYEGRPVTVKDYKQIIKLLDKDSVVNGIEAVNRFRSRRGKTFTKRSNNSKDILDRVNTYLIDKETAEKFLSYLRESLTLLERNESSNYATFAISVINAWKFYKSYGNTDDEILRELFFEIVECIEKDIGEDILFYLWNADYYELKDNNRPGKTLFDLEKEVSDGFKIPVDLGVILKNIKKLNSEEFKIKINKYSFADEQIIQLIDNKFSDNISEDDLKEIIKLMDQLRNIRDDIFDIIISKISEESLFKIWQNDEIIIDQSEKKFHYSRSFIRPTEKGKIDLKILKKYASEVTSNGLKKVHRQYDDSDEIIISLLKEKLDAKELFTDVEQIVDIIISVENDFLSFTGHKILLKNHFFECLDFLLNKANPDFFVQSLRIMSSLEGNKESYFSNLKNHLNEETDNEVHLRNGVLLYGHTDDSQLKPFFERVSNKLKDEDIYQILTHFQNGELVNIALKNWNFDSTKTSVQFINEFGDTNLENSDGFYEKFIQDLDSYSTDDLFSIFEKRRIKELKEYLISYTNFRDLSYLKQIISLTSDSDHEEILKGFYGEVKDLSFKYILEVLHEFKELAITIDTSFLIDKINNSEKYEYRDLANYAVKLKKIDSESVLKGIEGFIQKNGEEIEPLELINGDSPESMVELVLRYDEYISNQKLIESISTVKAFQHLSESVIKPILIKLSASSPAIIIELTREYYGSLLKKVLSSIELNNDNIIEVLKIIDRGKVVKEELKEKTHLHVVISYLQNHNEKANVDRLNNLFKETYYSFQLQFLKYIIGLYQKRNISIETFTKMLNDVKTVQLSALLVKAFIGTELKDRSDLMGLLNRLLKKHFKLLERSGVTKEIFNQVFSLSGLVNQCNGRKKHRGIDIQQVNGDEVAYKNRYHLKTEETLNIYCEGRFWKSLPFYNSRNNRPTGTNCDFYWCKGETCAKVNDQVNFNQSFEYWTLNEYNQLFHKGLDRLVFTHLAGWLNRMKSILNKLKCRECDNLLRPNTYVPKQLGYYAVPLFKCINDECINYNQSIRFTHCRGCHEILDSRECETCPECNWLICNHEECGKCGCGANHDPKYVQYPEA